MAASFFSRKHKPFSVWTESVIHMLSCWFRVLFTNESIWTCVFSDFLDTVTFEDSPKRLDQNREVRTTYSGDLEQGCYWLRGLSTHRDCANLAKKHRTLWGKCVGAWCQMWFELLFGIHFSWYIFNHVKMPTFLYHRHIGVILLFVSCTFPGGISGTQAGLDPGLRTSHWESQRKVWTPEFGPTESQIQYASSCKGCRQTLTAW